MVEIKVRENESLESALKRFKRQIQRDGIIQDIKKHEYYEKPSEVRKRKMIAAKKREKQRARRERSSLG